jgi:hypothetical protein
MAIQEERMRENEELFRTLNERLVDQVADTLEDDRVVPFLCECADDLCMARMEMTLAEFEQLRAEDGTFGVLPGHAVDDGEVVVRELDAYHVVRKAAA